VIKVWGGKSLRKKIIINSKNRFFKIFFFAFAILVLSTACRAQDRLKNKTLGTGLQSKTEITESASEEIVDSPSSAFVQYAKSAGVRKCLGRIEQVAMFLTRSSSNVGGHYFISPSRPDDMMISLSMEIQQPGAGPAYASASFAPNQANGCGGMYETVVYWPQDCETVARQHYPDLQRVGSLSSQIVVLKGSSSLKIFLMPAGTGCVAIKKEIVQ